MLILLLQPLCTLCSGRPAELGDLNEATCPKGLTVADCGALALYNASVGGGSTEELCGVPVEGIDADLFMRYMARPLAAVPEE